MVFSIALGILGLGMLCALLYRFAVYALPVFVGLSVGFWAFDTGAGPIGSVVAGLIGGVSMFVVGQLIFASSRSRLMRSVIALIFAAPAAYAGHQLMLQIGALSVPSILWQQSLAGISALVIGCTALTSLTISSER